MSFRHGSEKFHYIHLLICLKNVVVTWLFCKYQGAMHLQVAFKEQLVSESLTRARGLRPSTLILVANFLIKRVEREACMIRKLVILVIV